MLYKSLDPSLFALIQESSGLDGVACADALEVICGDLDTDAEALTWIYQTGTLVVGRMCRESYEDAHDPECDAAPAVCLYETNDGQLIAVCGVRAFLELQCSAVDFALDAAAILADDVQDWELERCDADRVAAVLAHPTTRFIATFSLPAGLALTDSQPGSSGLAYLGDGLVTLARIRVRSTPELAEHEGFILADWDEGGEALWWVATASIAEILAWVAAGR